jgi:hypothetical protein
MEHSKPVIASDLERHSQWRRFGRPLIGVSLIVALFGLIAATRMLIRLAWPRTYGVHMVTDLVPLRKSLAEQIRTEGRRHHLDLVLTAKHYGALEALEEVDAPNDIKLALVPGGITARDYPTVRMVTALTNEPLHIFVRPELADEGFRALRGKRIDLGPPTTSSHHLARQVLEFAGLSPTTQSGSAGYILETLAPEEVHRDLGRIESLKGQERAEAIAKLPDAYVFLAPMPSMFARRLVGEVGYQLLPVPFGEAFCLDRLNLPDSNGVRVDRCLLTPSVIPPYTYGTDPPVPVRPCPTISAPLLLIAQADAEPDAIYHLLETIYDSPLTNVIRPLQLKEQVSAFPLHPGTERYLRRNEPLLTPETTSNLGKFLGGIGAFASGVFALYTFLRLRKLSRFEVYYRELRRIELIAHGLASDPNAPTDPGALHTYLEDRLSALKCQVLEDFAEGGLRGEGLVAGIIALINDTRESIGPALTAHGRSSSNPVAGELACR